MMEDWFQLALSRDGCRSTSSNGEDDKIDALMDSKTRKAAGGSRNFCTLFSLPAAAIARSKLLYSPPQRKNSCGQAGQAGRQSASQPASHGEGGGRGERHEVVTRDVPMVHSIVACENNHDRVISILFNVLNLLFIDWWVFPYWHRNGNHSFPVSLLLASFSHQALVFVSNSITCLRKTEDVKHTPHELLSADLRHDSMITREATADDPNTTFVSLRTRKTQLRPTPTLPSL